MNSVPYLREWRFERDPVACFTERHPLEPITDHCLRFISNRFQLLFPSQGQVLAPYSPVRHWKHHFPSDLHVLSMPPAFILSQDQTLHEIPSCIALLIASLFVDKADSELSFIPRLVSVRFMPGVCFQKRLGKKKGSRTKSRWYGSPLLLVPKIWPFRNWNSISFQFPFKSSYVFPRPVFRPRKKWNGKIPFLRNT